MLAPVMLPRSPAVGFAAAEDETGGLEATPAVALCGAAGDAAADGGGATADAGGATGAALFPVADGCNPGEAGGTMGWAESGVISTAGGGAEAVPEPAASGVAGTACGAGCGRSAAGFAAEVFATAVEAGGMAAVPPGFG